MIFPLPLTPFEEYMLTDDRPGCPMTFLFRLRFSGRFRREAFASALRTAVSRHPLLRTHRAAREAKSAAVDRGRCLGTADGATHRSRRRFVAARRSYGLERCAWPAAVAQ